MNRSASNQWPGLALTQAEKVQDSAQALKWLRRGYIFIAVFFVTRLIYIASGRIQLSEDEAYQWLWSKHLALSYYSKPPLIAYLQYLGTHIWGDTEFGVRFFSPVLSALLSILLLRFMAAQASARGGFWLILMLAATPLAAVGSTMLTVDAPSVFFWVAALIGAWQAIQSDSLTPWFWTGIWLGLGLLSKYTAVVQVLSFLVFCILWPPARAQLRRPGPYLALAVACLAFVPVIWWNYQHEWITLTHLSERGGLNHAWHFQWRLPVEFFGAELGLLNPVFFVSMIVACVSFWKQAKGQPLLVYLFCMGAPLFLFYSAYTLRARVQPNWIAPSVVPLFALMTLYAEQRWLAGEVAVTKWLAIGLVSGFAIVGFLHATEVTQWVTGHPLPVAVDPLHRVREWDSIAQLIDRERRQLQTEGKPVFIITQGYSTASAITFYLPEAKQGVPNQPLIYSLRSVRPENQFYFWPGYQARKGQNAIYVDERDTPLPPPAALLADFTSVTEVGMRDAFYHGQIFRKFQIYACRNLR